MDCPTLEGIQLKSSKVIQSQLRKSSKVIQSQVDPSSLGFSLSSHRHSYISLLFSSRFIVS
jgi:hypothetical protein